MEAYIVKAYRSAVGKAGKGGFKFYRSDDLAVDVVKHMMEQMPSFDGKLVDDVIVGCANPEGEQGFQIGRQISLRAIGKEVPGVTVNRYCASGLETISIAVAKIKAGMGQCYIAGGTENMSMIPMTGYKMAPSYQVASTTPSYLTGMGTTAEAVAEKWGITREQADEFSYNSHMKAIAAIDEGKFKDEIVPILIKVKKQEVIFDQDEYPKAGSTVEKLAGLKPAFKKDGTVTAGNASGINDGAAAVTLMSGELADKKGLEKLVSIKSWASCGVDPALMGTGPIPSSKKALDLAGWNIKDVDLFEVNEAFAAQSLAVLNTLSIPEEKVNVNGGAIALGHPIGASGTRILVTLIHEMIKRDVNKGLATLCIGGGMGIAMCIER